MSASQEKRIEPPVSKLGILAGGGDIPRLLVDQCAQQGIEVFVIALEGQADLSLFSDIDHISARLGATGTTIKALKKHDIQDLVMIGRVRRPSLKELRPDLKTAEFFATEGLKTFGDDGLLKAIRRFLEKEGFQLHGAHEFMPNLLAREGVLGRVKPSKGQLTDIERGVEVLQALGSLDVGQAVVVQNGHVLGVEGAEGTDELIKRCGALQRKGTGAVLVKLCKPEQDMDIDLPTIGAQTIEHAIALGYSGVAVHAGHSFMHQSDAIQAMADKAKIFVTGINP